MYTYLSLEIILEIAIIKFEFDTILEDERERKIHVEIKPLSNGAAPMSASVDELRATVENLSLSPVTITTVFILLSLSLFIIHLYF